VVGEELMRAFHVIKMFIGFVDSRTTANQDGIIALKIQIRVVMD